VLDADVRDEGLGVAGRRWNAWTRLGAAVLVAVVLGGGAIALANRTPKVEAMTAGGKLCITYDTRVWTTAGTIVAPGRPEQRIAGSWSQSSDRVGQITADDGRVIELTTTQSSADNGDMRKRNVSCGIL
jgi:hypothetical protein